MKMRKTAMITGSSSGIGKAVAMDLASKGWFVILHGRSHTAHLLETQTQINSQGGRTAVLPCDLVDVDSLDCFVDSAWEINDGIQAWINAAGGDVLTGDWPRRPLIDKLQYLLAVDVTATLMLSRKIGSLMKTRFESFQAENAQSIGQAETGVKNPSGFFSILNMGWDQADQGMGGESGELFATTKGAIMAMTRSLAQSLAPAVRVNCLAPGWIKTAWGSEASDYWSKRARNESLMNRWGTPEDVASVSSFLCSDAASFISGQIVPINGGFRFSK